MYPEVFGSFATAILLINLIWVAVLTFFVWQERQFLQKLFPGNAVTRRDFRGKLEEVLQGFDDLEEFRKDSLRHLQKVALKRYNPYQDTGGDQSFSIALLDGLGNGVVITSLHSRAGTRVFAKPIKNGKEDNFQLSEEESIVVKEANV